MKHSKHLKTQKGAALVEYGLLVGLIAILAIVAVLSLGNTTRGIFNTVASTLSTQNDTAFSPSGGETTGTSTQPAPFDFSAGALETGSLPPTVLATFTIDTVNNGLSGSSARRGYSSGTFGNPDYGELITGTTEGTILSIVSLDTPNNAPYAYLSLEFDTTANANQYGSFPLDVSCTSPGQTTITLDGSDILNGGSSGNSRWRWYNNVGGDFVDGATYECTITS